jgi:hypothetical protein
MFRTLAGHKMDSKQQKKINEREEELQEPKATT